MKKGLILLLILFLSSCSSTKFNELEVEESLIDSMISNDLLNDLVSYNCFENTELKNLDLLSNYDLSNDYQNLCFVLIVNDDQNFSLLTYDMEHDIRVLESNSVAGLSDLDRFFSFQSLHDSSLSVDFSTGSVSLLIDEKYIDIFGKELVICDTSSLSDCKPIFSYYFPLILVSEFTRTSPYEIIPNYIVDFNDTLFTATLEEIQTDIDLLKKNYTFNSYYVYKGTIGETNIYRLSFGDFEISDCSQNTVEAVPVGDGYYLPGSSNACHESIFAVSQTNFYKLSGVEYDATIDDLNISATELCMINGICTTRSEEFSPSVRVTDRMIISDYNLLKTEGYNSDSYYELKALINGFRIYKLKLNDPFYCTDDMLPSVNLGDGFYIPYSNSGSCFESTVAIRNNTIYGISGAFNITTIEKLGISVHELCNLDGICSKSD